MNDETKFVIKVSSDILVRMKFGAKVINVYSNDTVLSARKDTEESSHITTITVSSGKEETEKSDYTLKWIIMDYAPDSMPGRLLGEIVYHIQNKSSLLREAFEKYEIVPAKINESTSELFFRKK